MRYAKAVVATLGALSVWGVAAGADGAYDQVELWGLLGVVATAALTYLVPNRGAPPPA